MKKEEIKKIVKESYGEIARKSNENPQKVCGCCSCSSSMQEQIAQSIGYSKEEIKHFQNPMNSYSGIYLKNLKMNDQRKDINFGIYSV